MSTMTYNEVFIFVAGSTPQIVTETIFALSQQQPPVHPNELFIITTSLGRKRIKETLVGQCILERMSAEYALPPIPLREDSFRVITDLDGNELEDIRTDTDNGIAGEIITRLIREKTSCPENRLHCSLAGGRKTMSFYLGSILQLFGRKWDNLYHVLVTPEFETNPHFYYRPAVNQEIECRLPDGSRNKLNTDRADIELVSLPFIRLREKLSLHDLGFKDLVAEGQREIDMAATQPELVVSLSDRSLTINNVGIDFIPVQIMIYAAFIRQKIFRCKYPEREYCGNCAGCFVSLGEFTEPYAIEEFMKDYTIIYNNPHRRQVLEKDWTADKLADKTKLLSNISKINRSIKDSVTDTVTAGHCIIACEKKYGNSRYGVRLDKGKITFSGERQ